MNIIIKLLTLFLGIDIFIFGLFKLNILLIILGLINTLFLIYLSGYRFNFIKVLVNSIKSNYKSNINFKFKISIKNDLKEFGEIIREINKHYILITSLLVFLFALFSKLLGFKTLELNLNISFFILLISIIVGYKDIYTKEVYLGTKKLTFPDLVVFLSFILFYIFFNINGDLKLYERFFIASLFSLVFFVFVINYLGIGEPKFGKYKAKNYFLILFFISTISFAYGFLNLKNIYNDFYIGKTKIVTKEHWEKVFVTPDEIEYRIIKDGDLYTMKLFDGTYYSFRTLKDAENYILGFYKEKENKNDKLIRINNPEILTGSMTDKEFIPYLLKDKNFDEFYNGNLVLPHISRDLENYKFYNIAYNIGLINLDSDLSDKVYCLNYTAMRGIVEKWDTKKYGNIDFFEKYYLEGINKGLVPQECVENKYQLFKWEFIAK